MPGPSQDRPPVLHNPPTHPMPSQQQNWKFPAIPLQYILALPISTNAAPGHHVDAAAAAAVAASTVRFRAARAVRSRAARAVRSHAARAGRSRAARTMRTRAVRLFERIGGDPEAVLKSRHLSDYGPAPPSRTTTFRRPRVSSRVIVTWSQTAVHEPKTNPCMVTRHPLLWTSSAPFSCSP